jgi:hypothetical protein
VLSGLGGVDAATLFESRYERYRRIGEYVSAD